MRTRLARIMVGVSLLALAGSAQPASAAEVVFVAGPGGPFVNYTVPLIVVSQGDTLTYANVDVFLHDVVAREKGPNAKWCAEAGFGKGECPVFWTPLIGLGASTTMRGLDNVEPGTQYEFFCSIHVNMVGTMVVLPSQ